MIEPDRNPSWGHIDRGSVSRNQRTRMIDFKPPATDYLYGKSMKRSSRRQGLKNSLKIGRRHARILPRCVSLVSVHTYLPPMLIKCV